MSTKLKLAKGLGLILGLGIGVSAWASPTCPTGINFNFNQSVQFGDGFSQSLPLSGLSVQSSPGQISDCLVVATGPNGGPVTDNQNLVPPGSVDNAYETPNGPNANSWFRTGDPNNSQDPLPAFTGDRPDSWDVKGNTLKSFLAGNALLFYFNHNQTNSGSAIDQDLFIWAQIVVRSSAGTVKAIYDFRSMVNTTLPDNFGCLAGSPSGTETCTFDKTGGNYTSPGLADNTYPSGTQGAAASAPKLADFVRARGQLCTLGGTIVPCGTAGATTFNTNLGADHVANAIFFPELQALINGGSLLDNDVLSIDLRMGCNPLYATCPAGSVLNNGYEQLFIVRAPQQGVCPDPTNPICTPDTPEPGTLALVGLAAIGLAATRRKLVRKGDVSAA